MASGLVEREHELATLVGAVDDALEGHGSITLVQGEAGIGKSCLVAALTDAVGGRARVLTGWCDDLSTPRILGPIRDIAADAGTELASAVAGPADRDALITALHADLNRPGRATVLIVEDLQWVDDATADWLRHLARRISRMPVALVLTYRHDFVGHRDRMSAVLGEVAGSSDVRRLELRPLSRQAVGRMADGSRLDPDELYALTSGNPFFVAEVLTVGPVGRTPPTVVDAVLSRLHGLPARVRRTVEQLAVIPVTVPRWLAEKLVSEAVADLDVAEAHGLLVVEPLAVSFRHEITRRAVADSLSGALRVELNRRALTAWSGRTDSDPARLMHHATEAGDVATLVRLGPRVARDAARAGAHRQAVATYRRLLDHRRHFSPPDQANLLEQYAIECYITGSDEAVGAQMSAVQLYETLGDQRALGSALRWLSRMHWRDGRRADAEKAAQRAVDVLSFVGDQRQLALAYSTQSQFHVIARRKTAGVRVSRRARRLTDRSHDPLGLPHSLMSLGSVYWTGGVRTAGQALVEDSIRAALAVNDIDEACRAYANLAWMLIDDLHLDDAASFLADAVQLAERAEHLGSLEQLRTIQAFLGFLTGDWDAAMRDAEKVSDSTRPLTRCTFMVVVGRIRIRRGLPGGDELLAEAIQLARELGADQLGVASAGRAEAAWLSGDVARARRLAEPAYEWAVSAGHSRLERAELGYWLVRTGGAVSADDPGHPYALGNSGQHREAAARWAEIGCPYEHAAALGETGHPEESFAAVRQLEALGARPLARLVQARLPARRPVTQQEIATLLGVSQATVSLALNGHDGDRRVSTETRERVMQAALNTGYLIAGGGQRKPGDRL